MESSKNGEAVATGEASPNRRMIQSDASINHEEASKSPKRHAEESSFKFQAADAHKPTRADASPRAKVHADNDMDISESGPSAVDLAKKRAERFGIPVYGDKPAAENKNGEEKDSPIEADEATNQDTLSPQANALEQYRDLLVSALPEDSILLIDDMMGDGRNAKLIQKYLEANDEEKFKALIAEMIKKIADEFSNDRNKIQIPVKLASFRLSKMLRLGLPKQERRERPERSDKYEKSDKTTKKTWTDAEWAEWSKKSEGWKKGGDWKKGKDDWKAKDWNSGKRKNYGDDDYYKGDYKKSRHDPFESDVEEFIRSNRLDKRCADVMRTESKGMATFVMDQGFNLRKCDNPSKEVMLRMKDYIRSKRGDRGGQQGYNNYPKRSRSRSYSRGRSISRSRSRSGRPMQVDSRRPAPAANQSRDYSRSRSRSRSDSRDRYARRSRSVSV